MKRIILILTTILSFSLISLSQDSHLSLIYDFEGNDFDYAVKGMVGTNDSLYIINNTPNGQGRLFRIDENGDGYEVIWEFDDVNYAPNSLVANDTVIYGTTRFSPKGGGTLFKYSLQTYSFEFIKDFDPFDVQEVQVKYVTDSVLWLNSQWSFVDEGSVFTIEKDGTQLKKIYNDTDSQKGQNPVDFVFHKDSIYIACYNGGGTPYPDGTGSTVSSGSFIRIKSDGTGYENLVKGGDGVGTQPQSLIIREDKLIGLFANSGSHSGLGGQFFRCDLDGSSIDSLGALKHRTLTKLLSTDSLIYGISAIQIFGINPFDGEIRIFEDLLSEPDFGYDVVANPTFLNGNIFLATQQGGPDFGGTILKWNNQDPEVNDTNTKSSQTSSEIVLSDLFTDPEGDRLTYDYEYDSEVLSLSESNGRLTLTPLQSGEVKIKITANDGWVGYKSVTINLGIVLSVLNERENPSNLLIYPNPTNSILNLGPKTVELVEIFTMHGKLIKSYKNPGDKINISSLNNGVYLLRYLIDGDFYSQKIIKN